ncbi:unnamed protein product [Caenorhabditis angaria]|uniref:Uncharacterized protein n=1 Tax=Caenorhabditis angaria TaxID=860376 RepID=A0A9P1N7S7_9PELO|nr:unnamed protein product [Caenorhabditis angaria]
MTFLHNVLLVILFAAVIVSPFQLMQPKRILHADKNDLFRRQATFLSGGKSVAKPIQPEEPVQPEKEEQKDEPSFLQQLEQASYFEPYESAIVAKRLRGEPIRFGKRSPREPIRFGKRSNDYDFQ